MKIFQKILSTLKRVLPSKKEIDKEIGEIPMKSSKEIWLCPLVTTKVLEEGQTADELYEGYVTFGDDPFIIPTPTNKEVFSAWNYAKRRCKEICG